MERAARVRHAVAALAVAGAVTGAVVALGGTSSSAAPTPRPPVSPVPGPTPPGGLPLDQQAQAGRLIFLRDCAWCHGNEGQGGDFGPDLQGVGAESADFMLSTGRMPIPRVEDQPQRKHPSYTREQIDDLVSFVASLGAGPTIPPVDPAAGNLQDGANLYEENCAACHSSTGIGGALTSGLQAPPLVEVRPSLSPRQIVEAIRLGGAGLRTGKMPKFGPDTLSQQQVNSIVRYVQYLENPDNRGGASLARIGPVAEGFVAWIGAMLILVLFVRYIGKREPGK